MKKTMNMIELIHVLDSMDNTTRYQQYMLDGVKSAIIRMYCEKVGFYEENAIESYKQFLETGNLNFN